MNVRLKKVQKNDSGLIVKWRNENKEFFPDQPDFTVGSQVNWFVNTYLLDPADHYYIVVADGTPVGTVAIDAKEGVVGRVLLGNKEFARKGIMGEALEKIVGAYGFYTYYLKVLESNKDAIAFYKKHFFFGYGTQQGFLFMERVNA